MPMQVKDRNRERRRVSILAIICLVLQLAVSPNLAIFNGHINFALIFSSVVALSYGGTLGVVLGFLSGLTFDLLSNGPFGLMALLLTISSYFLGLELRNRIADDFRGSLTAFLNASLAVSAVYSLMMLVVGASNSLFDSLLLRALPTAIMTCIVFIPFCLILARRDVNRPVIGSSMPKLNQSDSSRSSS